VNYSAIETMRFADGSSLTQPQILALLTASQSTPGDDLIFGTQQNDTVAALAGNDNIHGLGGNDQLSGGAGNDVLMGDDGSDLLDGGTGNDILIGGRGSDSYLFEAGHGADVINNAAEASGKVDQIQFGASINRANVSVKRDGNDLLINTSATDSIRVTDYFRTRRATGPLLSRSCSTTARSGALRMSRAGCCKPARAMTRSKAMTRTMFYRAWLVMTVCLATPAMTRYWAGRQRYTGRRRRK